MKNKPKNKLKKFLTHPWINAAGVGQSLYPERTPRQAGLNIRNRKRLSLDEIETIRPHMEELISRWEEVEELARKREALKE